MSNKAQAIVDRLLEAMNRRRFFGLFGRGAAAAAVAPQMLAAAVAPAAAPAAAAAAAAPARAAWTVGMSQAMRDIRNRFVEERVRGFHSPNGRYNHPVPLEQAIERWTRAFPKFVGVIKNVVVGSEMDRRYVFTQSRPAPHPAEPWADMSPEQYAARFREKYPELDQPQQERPQQQQQEQPQQAQAQQQQQQPRAAKKAKRVWPERAQRGPEEEEWFGAEQESVYTPFMKAQVIVDRMLDEAYDEHVKAHERVQKWDNAHDSFGKLYALKHKSMDLFRELGRSIGYERALARIGLSRQDVAHPIYGAQIGSTHNYKQTRSQRRCQNVHCNDRGPKPESQAECSNCGEPLVTKQMPYSPSDLRGKFARHMLGVETNDGRRVWFDAPLPPQPELEPEAPASTAPTTPKDMEEQKRLGKWW